MGNISHSQSIPGRDTIQVFLTGELLGKDAEANAIGLVEAAKGQLFVHHMFLMIASANCEHFASVAPSIWRARS